GRFVPSPAGAVAALVDGVALAAADALGVSALELAIGACALALGGALAIAALDSAEADTRARADGERVGAVTVVPAEVTEVFGGEGLEVAPNKGSNTPRFARNTTPPTRTAAAISTPTKEARRGFGGGPTSG